MDTDAAKVCTELVQQFNQSAQFLIGAILTIVVNIIVMVKLYLSTRKSA